MQCGRNILEMIVVLVYTVDVCVLEVQKSYTERGKVMMVVLVYTIGLCCSDLYLRYYYCILEVQ